MGIKFLCPNGHKMNVKAFLAGKRGKCPKCGASVRIPRETPASDSGEDLLADPSDSTAPPAGVLRMGLELTAAAASSSTIPARQVPVQAPYSAESSVKIGAPAVRPALPMGAPAIPTVATVTPGYQPAGPAAMRGMQAVPSLPMGTDPIAQAPSSIWYVRPPSGGQFGPARGDIMRKWVAEGRVSGDSLVWREGFPEWKTAGQLFPSLAGIGSPVAAAEPPPPPADIAEAPKVTRAVRKLNAYEARKHQGNGAAIAILIVLGIICAALIVGLAVVLSQGNNGSSKDAPKKSAAVVRH